MSESAYRAIENHEVVVEHFGYWPTFHDAEILRVEFRRRHILTPPGPSLALDVHAFEITSETDSRGHYKLDKHCIVTFEFDNVRMLSFEHFNHQNAVYEIGFSVVRDIDGRERLEVVVVASHGMSARFSAYQVVVSSLVVGKPDREGSRASS
jgi:hypothetical protein